MGANPGRLGTNDMNGTDNFSRTRTLGLEILKTMEVAALLRRSPGNYQFYGLAPCFYTRFFPLLEDGSPCDAPWRHSPMLEFFLAEAEEFFERAEAGSSISSGLWVEEAESGEEVPLMATARVLPEARLILIQAVREEYAERARILRRARQELVKGRGRTAPPRDSEEKSDYDELTRLYRREAFFDILQNQTAGLLAYAPNLALLMLDIDDFKKINDDLGAAVGDSVLVQTGGLLRKFLRKSDVPARYDHEKFAILAPSTSFSQAFLVGEKLRGLVAEHDFGLGRRATVSIGCTIYRPGEDAREFISRAEAALGEAKRDGKNRVRQRDPWIDQLGGAPDPPDQKN